MEEKDEVLEYMINKEWENERKLQKRDNLIKIAQNGLNSKSIDNQMGGVLIYNQIIEQVVKELILMSLAYIRAEIWPAKVSLNIDLDKATLGREIELFKKFALIHNNHKKIVEKLYKFQEVRNSLVHNMFDIKNDDTLINTLDQYKKMINPLIHSFSDYHKYVRWELEDLARRVDFEDLV